MRNARGFTLIELLIVIAIVGILLSIAMAAYRYARIRGDEAAAISALGSINEAQVSFMNTCGNQRFAPTLPSLGTPVPGTGTAYLSPDLTQGVEVVKSGYLIRMAGTEVEDATPTCTGVTPVSSYQVTADPLNPGISGMRAFGTNTGRLLYEDSATFAGNMPETGPPTHGTEIR